MWSGETDAAQRQLEENGEWGKAVNEADQKSLATTQAYYNRLNAARSDQVELETCQPMARALFGEPLEQAIEKLLHQFWSVKVYVDANHQDKRGADAEFRLKIESTIWEGYPSKEENQVDRLIAEQIEIIERVCLPALRLEA